MNPSAGGIVNIETRLFFFAWNGAGLAIYALWRRIGRGVRAGTAPR